MTTVTSPIRRIQPADGQPKRNWLAEVTTKAKPLPTAAVLYGVPGIGKTSLAAQIPGVVFLVDRWEDGLNTLKAAGLVPESVPQLPPIHAWQEALDALEALATEDHPYRALAVDALGGFERLCHEEVCRREFGGEWGERGFMGYMRGYETALADWRQFLALLDRLRREKRMSIMLLGHAKIAPFKNPEGPDYDRWQIDIHHKTWSLTHKWVDMVLFANYEVVFTSTEERRGKGKAKGGQRRVIYTEYTPAFDAKNRHGLPPEIDMGSSPAEAWANVSAHLKLKKGD